MHYSESPEEVVRTLCFRLESLGWEIEKYNYEITGFEVTYLSRTSLSFFVTSSHPTLDEHTFLDMFKNYGLLQATATAKDTDVTHVEKYFEDLLNPLPEELALFELEFGVADLFCEGSAE